MEDKGRNSNTCVFELAIERMEKDEGQENEAFVRDDEFTCESHVVGKDCNNAGSCEAKATKPKKYNLDRLFLKRFFLCSKIIFPKVICKPTILFILLLVASVFQQYIIYNVGLIPSRFFKVLGAKDKKGFRPLVFTAVYFIVAIALGNSTVKYISGVLYVQWRDAITTRLHRKYFFLETFFHINTKEQRIDNADQRMTQDVDKFSQQFSEISSKLIISPFTIAYYSYQCFSSTGYFGPVSIYVYFVLGSIINRVIMSPIVSLVVQQEKNEGDFRFKHVNIRTNSESIAFLQGSKIEGGKVNTKLQQLLKIQQTIVNFEFWLNLSVNLFDYLGSVLSYFVIAIPIFAGSYDDLNSVQLSSLISKNAFVSMYLINCFSTLMDLASKITDIAGYTHRIGEFHEQLDSQSKECKNSNDCFERKCEANAESHGQSIFYDLRSVTYSPTGSSKNLMENMNMTIISGKSILIMGATGTGKSSLLRLLRNLWQPESGEVNLFLRIDPRNIYFLPQRCFLTSGSLFDQVMYPLEVDKGSDTVYIEKQKAQALQCIKDVGLGSLVDRINGLETNFGNEWYSVLSPGEMQRLSFARIFFHKPKLAILDEPTSALGEEEEECFYLFCKQLNITLISVGHRESLMSYHENLLMLKGDGTWQFKELQP